MNHHNNWLIFEYFVVLVESNNDSIGVHNEFSYLKGDNERMSRDHMLIAYNGEPAIFHIYMLSVRY